MKILQRYLTRTLLETTGLVMLIVLGLALFIAFLSELRDIGHGSYSIFSALIYVLLDLPTQLYRLFPMLGLLGVLLGLGLLANHHELIVLRISGVSVFQVDVMVIKMAVVMVLLVTVLGEWVAPRLEHVANQYKVMKTSNGQIFKTIRGLWVRDHNWFIHIDTVLARNHLADVTVYQFDDQHRLVKSWFAKTATYQKPVWQFKQVIESTISEKQITTQNEAEKTLALSLNPKLIQFSRDEPEDLSLTQLTAYMRFLQTNHLHDPNYAFAFWQRMLQPFATLVMMLLAIPFVFGPLRSTTRGLRVLVGILIGFSFYILNQFFGPISIVYQFPPILAAASPLLVFSLLALFLSYLANQRR
jgi:Predicted permeases